MAELDTQSASPAAVGVDFASDRLRLLRPFITANAIELAVRRVIYNDFTIIRRGRKGGKEQIIKAQGTDTELKVALLIVKEINPIECLNAEEEAMLRGVGRKTIGTMRAQGRLPEK